MFTIIALSLVLIRDKVYQHQAEIKRLEALRTVQRKQVQAALQSQVRYTRSFGAATSTTSSMSLSSDSSPRESISSEAAEMEDRFNDLMFDEKKMKNAFNADVGPSAKYQAWDQDLSKMLEELRRGSEEMP